MSSNQKEALFEIKRDIENYLLTAVYPSYKEYLEGQKKIIDEVLWLFDLEEAYVEWKGE